jgi:prophage antirepressor-like protein
MSNTNNKQSLFDFQGHDIRIVIHNGEPWFVAKDICETLGIANHRDTIASLPGHQKDYVGISDAIGRERITTIISEAALYKLAFRSNKEEAEVFTDWVASVVLPTIRKTGSFSLTQEEPQAQPSQWLNWDAALIATLSKDEHMRLIHYERARLSFLESAYNYKYPQVHNSEYPQEEQRPHPIETLALSPVEAKPDLQTTLLDYLHKTGTSVTVRQLQQSGPRILRNLSADQLRTMLQTLVENGVLAIVQLGKAEHYRLL